MSVTDDNYIIKRAFFARFPENAQTIDHRCLLISILATNGPAHKDVEHHGGLHTVSLEVCKAIAKELPSGMLGLFAILTQHLRDTLKSVPFEHWKSKEYVKAFVLNYVAYMDLLDKVAVQETGVPFRKNTP